MPLLFNVSWGAVSGWWLPLCLLAGVLYAWVMYRQPSVLNTKWRVTLFVFRAFAVSILALLLLSPLVQSIKYEPEKPLVLVLQDNSQSLGGKHQQHARQVAAGLQKLQKQLGNGYDVRETHFNKDVQPGITTTFNGKRTDIANALRNVSQQYANQNIGAVIVATDGLYNTGADPQYEAWNIKAGIYTIAMGDTTAQRDLLISNVNYNKTAFIGNDFMIEVLAEAYQLREQQMTLRVTENGKPLYSEQIKVNDAAFKRMVPVKLHAGTKGLHKYTISLTPVANEVTISNNNETIYVDVLDDRQKILLVYDAMHPDIGVLKTAIEASSKYQVKISTVGELQAKQLSDINLLICFHIDESTSPLIKQVVATGKLPVWYLLGADSRMPPSGGAGRVMNYAGNPGDVQESFADANANFSAFALSDSCLTKLSQMPPLLVPSGNYSLAQGSSVLFTQRIGNVHTSYPLLAFSLSGGARVAVLSGEGLWHWRLTEFSRYGSHHALEELAAQCVQYLTADASRKQFDAYANKNVYDEGDDIILNAELYNDALELVNTPDVKLSIKADKGRKYDYLFSRTERSYQLNAGALPPGEYAFTASTAHGAEKYNASGRFTIQALNLELRQTAANHRLLHDIASQSGGQMLYPDRIGELAKLIKANANAKTVVYQDKTYRELIDIKWVFFIVLALLSAEWLLRKREGEV